MSIDLMIRMGLVHMLIKRLELNTKDLTESHNTNTLKNKDVKKSLRDDDDTDDEADAVVAKRVKIDYSPNRFIPVRVPQISNRSKFCKERLIFELSLQRNIDSPPASTSSISIVMTPNNSPCSSISRSPRSLSPVNTKGEMKKSNFVGSKLTFEYFCNHRWLIRWHWWLFSGCQRHWWGSKRWRCERIVRRGETGSQLWYSPANFQWSVGFEMWSRRWESHWCRRTRRRR